jgi:hypothetical protein
VRVFLKEHPCQIWMGASPPTNNINLLIKTLKNYGNSY